MPMHNEDFVRWFCTLNGERRIGGGKLDLFFQPPHRLSQKAEGLLLSFGSILSRLREFVTIACTTASRGYPVSRYVHDDWPVIEGCSVAITAILDRGVSENGSQGLVNCCLQRRYRRVGKSLCDGLRIESLKFPNSSLKAFNVLALLLNSMKWPLGKRRVRSAGSHANRFLHYG